MRYLDKIAIVVLLLVFGSCSMAKKASSRVNTSKEVIRNSRVQKDSSLQVMVNKPIHKENYISLKTSDSIANARINEVLRTFRSVERSGNNATEAYYDAETMQLILKSVIGETQSREVKTNFQSEKESSVEEKIDSYFFKKIKVMPWWLWGLVAVWLLPSVIDKVIKIVNPIRVWWVK